MEVNDFVALTVIDPNKIVGIEVLFVEDLNDIDQALLRVEQNVKSDTSVRDLLGIYVIRKNTVIVGVAIILHDTVSNTSVKKLLEDLDKLNEVESVEATVDLEIVLATENSILIEWSDSVPSGTGYKIERSLDGITYSQIAVVSKGVTTYNNTGLNSSTVYCYRVRGYKGTTNYSYSNVVSATTTAVSGSGIIQNLTFENLDTQKISVLGNGINEIESPFGLENFYVDIIPTPSQSPAIDISIIDTDRNTGLKCIETKTLYGFNDETAGNGIAYWLGILRGTDKKHAEIEFAVKTTNTAYGDGFYETVMIGLWGDGAEDVAIYRDTSNNDGQHDRTTVDGEGNEQGTQLIPGRLMTAGTWNIIKIVIDENGVGNGTIVFTINGTDIAWYKRAALTIDKAWIGISLCGGIPSGARLLIDDFKVTIS